MDASVHSQATVRIPLGKTHITTMCAAVLTECGRLTPFSPVSLFVLHQLFCQPLQMTK